MHVLSIKNPNKIGPGSVPSSPMMIFFTPRARDFCCTGTLFSTAIVVGICIPKCRKKNKKIMKTKGTKYPQLFSHLVLVTEDDPDTPLDTPLDTSPDTSPDKSLDTP